MSVIRMLIEVPKSAATPSLDDPHDVATDIIDMCNEVRRGNSMEPVAFLSAEWVDGDGRGS